MSGMGWSAALARRGRFFWVAAAVRPSGGGGYAAVRVLLAVVFFVAAALKGHELATGPLLGDGLLASRPVLIALVEFEWVLGLCMLFGLYPKRTWQVALACFSAFACVSLYKGLAGDASCGCFGRLEVSPWYTLALDVVAVLALFLWPPRDRAPGDEPDSAADPKRLLRLSHDFSRVGVVAAVALFTGMPGALLMATYRPATLGDDGMIDGLGNAVLLEPEKWVGKRFPLLKHVDIGGRLAHGNWLVVLYRHDCPDCQEMLERYVVGSELREHRGSWPRVALVEVPPFAASRIVRVGSTVVFGRLSQELEWFVNTPAEFLLEQGSVLRLAVGSDANRRQLVRHTTGGHEFVRAGGQHM